MRTSLFLLSTIFILNSCTMSPAKRTKVTSSSAAGWYNKSDIKSVLILTNDIPMNEKEKNDLIIGLRQAFTNKNIDNTSYMDSETIMNHTQTLKNKIQEVNPKYILEVSQYNSYSLLWRLVNVEKDSEAWKGFTPFYVTGSGMAEAVLKDLTEKGIL